MAIVIGHMMINPGIWGIPIFRDTHALPKAKMDTKKVGFGRLP
jgi:hypothetical protein